MNGFTVYLIIWFFLIGIFFQHGLLQECYQGIENSQSANYYVLISLQIPKFGLKGIRSMGVHSPMSPCKSK
jgi:hypothetical protein